MRRYVALAALLLAAGPGAVHIAEPLPQPGTQIRTDGSCWPGPPGTDPALCPPNDPRFPGRWEFLSTIPDSVDRRGMHPAEVANGSIGFSLDRAWQRTTGRDDVTIAVLDSGIRWNDPDLANKIYLNAGELPFPEGAEAHDANADGVFDIRDWAGDSRVADANANGALDAGDLIAAFSDCRDDDTNGYVDDIAGYDFFTGSHCGRPGGDNDPADTTDFGHGTGIASTAAAETNNGIGNAGVCPECRILPVRVGDTFVVDANRFARGLVFAVRAGADVVGSALGSYNNTPSARAAVDFAYARGVPLIASAADEFSYHHNYPSVYNHTLYVNAIRYNHSRDFRKATTFWGLNPCTNFGARVGLSVPATSCSSGATSRLAGVAGLLVSAARDAGIDDLHAEEIYQILQATADDLDNTEPNWGDARYPARPGFDQIYGYGRLNALRAVEAVAAGEIPPRADLENPRWFAVVSPRATPVLAVRGSIRLREGRRATYRLELAPGVEPAEKDYRTVGRGKLQGRRDGRLGVIDLGKLRLPDGPAPSDRSGRDRYSVTLRLRVVDDAGRTAEARRSFFVLDDPAWKGGPPLDIGVSGEAAPVLADLDGDGRDEIVLPTADGMLRIISRETGGWVTLGVPLDSTPPVDPLEPDARPRETVIRAAVVGDLHGDGSQAIVVASREGRVYAFNGRGERIPGFPVAIDPAHGAQASPTRHVSTGILSAPVLADLDGRKGLEIVVTALDGHVYAWGRDGAPVPGFPVGVEAAGDGRGAVKIVSTPAVGDIDGDGEPEIVFGVNGLRDGTAAAYAVRSRGRRHPGGAFVPGWAPVEMTALRELLPTLAAGVQMGPLLSDVDGDGDSEVAIYPVTGDRVVLLDHDAAAGEARVAATYALDPGPSSRFAGTSFLTGTGSATLADTDGDGKPELYAPLLSFRLLTLRAKPGIPLDVPLALGGWNLGDPPGPGGRVAMLEGYPRRMEDLMVFARPAGVDVDGDGRPEILMGSGGYLLHAFRRTGGEAPGFPKFTGGWIFSAAASGDLDGDGGRDLVAVTREGYLFIWDLGWPAGPEAGAASSDR